MGVEAEDANWLVVVIFDTEPAVYRFDNFEEARALYERYAVQWSQCWLTQVKHGPGPRWWSTPPSQLVEGCQ